jgi:chromosome segregation ATPase
MLLREQSYCRYVEYLRLSRSVPMQIEDLGSRIASLRAQKAALENASTALWSTIETLGQNNRSIRAQIAAKATDRNDIHAEAAATRARLEDAGEEIKPTQKALLEANERLEAARARTAIVANERADAAARLADARRAMAAELAALEAERERAEAAVDQIQRARDRHFEAASERVQALRRRLAHIREKGDDPEVPRVDVDLRHQIERVRAERAELVREGQRVDEEARRVEVQLRQKTSELQTIAMKMPPTQGLLVMPAFQEKFVLLKELVLQNMDLRSDVTRLTERIAAVQRENAEMRRKLTYRK